MRHIASESPRDGFLCDGRSLLPLAKYASVSPFRGYLFSKRSFGLEYQVSRRFGHCGKDCRKCGWWRGEALGVGMGFERSEKLSLVGAREVLREHFSLMYVLPFSASRAQRGQNRSFVFVHQDSTMENEFLTTRSGESVCLLEESGRCT
jgi:hypothetical protein